MEFNNLQLVNKTPLYVKQGKCPPIKIQNFPFTCEYCEKQECQDIILYSVICSTNTISVNVAVSGV